MNKTMLTIAGLLGTFAVLCYVLLLVTYLLFETDPIRTWHGAWNALTFQCYSPAGGNDWCDPNDPNHRAP